MKRTSCKKHLILALQFVVPAAFGAAVDCTNTALSAKALHNLPGVGYWMQMSGDCRVTYTSQGGISSRMYNLCQRKSEHINDDIDAFGLPEGDLFVQPVRGLSFMKISDAIKSSNSTAEQPIFSDTSHTGNYESVGTLAGGTPEKRTVRIAMGSARGVVRDYNIEKTGADDYKITALGDKPTKICQNIKNDDDETLKGLDREIPILSRNGLMIAGRRLDSRKTEIFEISMPSGDCKSIAKTPSMTSKVSFSFDNKSILYVTQDPNTQRGRLTKMDLATGKTTTLSGPDENVLYVTTRRDGSIFYTRGTLYSETSELVEIPPDGIPDVKDPKTYEAMGLAWGEACGKSLDLDAAYAIGIRMNKTVCKQVASAFNPSKLDDGHKSVSAAKIAEACNTSTNAAAPAAAIQ